MAATPSQKSQVINAPSEAPVEGIKSIFLAGTTAAAGNDVDWRQKLSQSLAGHPVTIFNPSRPDWDSTWREDVDFAPYRQQVLWELDKRDRADLVVVYFHPATLAPISLLELGLSVAGVSAGGGEKVVVAVAPVGYAKRGNVQIVCQKYGIDFLDDIDGVYEVIVGRLGLE